MSTFIRVLSLLLALQLAITAIILWPSTEPEAGAARSALLSLDVQDVSRIVVRDSEKSVLIQRTGNTWSLPDYHRLPVDPGKMDSLLKTLPELPRGWPVATSDNALQRFEVADDHFQRQVSWFSGEDEAGSLFLGTSPGFRKIHARPGDSEEVFSVEFNSFDLPVDAAAWMDKTLLQLDDIQSVTGLDYTLSLENGSWSAGEETPPEQSVVDQLINGLQSLRIDGVADLATAGLLDETEVPATLSVSSGDRKLEYRLYEIGDAHYVRRADIPIYFSLSALDYDRINDVNAAGLFPPAEEELEADPSG